MLFLNYNKVLTPSLPGVHPEMKKMQLVAQNQRAFKLTVARTRRRLKEDKVRREFHAHCRATEFQLKVFNLQRGGK